MSVPPSIDAFVPSAGPAEGNALGASVRGYLAGVREHLAALQASGARGSVVNTANSDKAAKRSCI